MPCAPMLNTPAADLEALHAAYGRLVHGLAVRFVGAQDADDVAQRVWLRVWRRNSFRGEAKVTSWLHVIVRNMAKDWARDHAAWQRAIALTGVDVRDPAVPVDLRLAQAQQHARVHRAIRRLSPEQQAVILARLSGLTLAATASALGLSLAATKSRQERGFVRLRQLLRH